MEWSLPQGYTAESPTWLYISVVIIYYDDIRGRWWRLDYLAYVLRLLLGHTVIGLCRHIYFSSISSAICLFIFSSVSFLPFLTTNPCSELVLTCLLHPAGKQGFDVAIEHISNSMLNLGNLLNFLCWWGTLAVHFLNSFISVWLWRVRRGSDSWDIFCTETEPYPTRKEKTLCSCETTPD